ncbi:MAG: hypothetical protein AAGA54_18550 [Myxococcota bacterium]
MGRRLKIAAIVGGLLLAAGGAMAYRLLRVDDIPAELEPAGDPRTLVIPGIGSQPELDVSKKQGTRLFFVFVGLQSWSGDEGKKLNRALNRWVLPDDLEGYIIFDAEGLGFLQEKSGEYMDRFGKETRFQMYGDFVGAFRQVFKLPRGHHGFVVVDGDGTMVSRHSGGYQTDDELGEVRALLGAQEPAPGPDVPPFEVGGLSQSACASTPCALLFLGGPVKKADIPNIDDGFEGDDEAKWAQYQKPAVRNAGSVLNLAIEGKAKGAIVGDSGDLEFLPGWSVAADDAQLRAAFDVAPDQTSLLVLREGTVAYRGDGVIPFYQWGQISDLLGVEFDFDD